MGGEIDCLLSDKSSTSSRDYCELKTNRVLTTERQKESFEKFKLLRVWGQSFLAGVPTIIFGNIPPALILGYRDDHGNLVSTETMKTLELPRRVRSKGYWDPNVCLGFLNDVLTFISDRLSDIDDPDTVFRLKFEAGGSSILLEGPVGGGERFI
jgi:RAT1-interacting protein